MKITEIVFSIFDTKFDKNRSFNKAGKKYKINQRRAYVFSEYCLK
jgi:hypothetical protein